MRAVRVDPGAGAVGMVEVADPDPGDGAVLVDVTHVGICGSDLHLVERGVTHTLGHEFGGMVDGRAVAVEPMVHCGGCDACRAGHTARCSVGTRGLWGIHRDGGMADAVAVDPSCVVELPGGLDPADVALVEPLAVGVHALHRAEVGPGVRVGVVGAGSVGLVAAALAARAGAEVDVAARHPGQVAAVERLGLRPELGRRYDVVVEAAGTASALATAVDVARTGATVVLPGTYWSPVELPGLAAQLKELALLPAVYYGHHHGEREFDTAARVLADAPELVDVLVTHHFPLDDAAEAFATAADKTTGAIKVILDV